MSKKILVLPGDGIGPEIVAEAVKVLAKAQQATSHALITCRVRFTAPRYPSTWHQDS